MAPAIECRGCGFKIKTKNEPATEEEMQKLFNVVESHRISTTSVGGQGLGAFLANNWEPNDSRFIYYEKTPAKGFTDARVVQPTKSPTPKP